jgi:hypothetical protein
VTKQDESSAAAELQRVLESNGAKAMEAQDKAQCRRAQEEINLDKESAPSTPPTTTKSKKSNSERRDKAVT